MMRFHACLLCLILIQQAYSMTCPAGSYKSFYRDKCYICPAGSFCPGDNSWITCKSGYYAEKSGSTSCKICPAGHRCYYVNVAPMVCLKGQYQDQMGQRFCKSCNNGEYSLTIGRTTKCDICPAGHRCPYLNAAPIKCTKGKYQDQTGQRSCKWCKDGEYSLKTGRTTKCDICPVGHRCPYLNAAPIKCTKGKYQDQTGQRSCKWCKDGEYSLETGRTLKCDICPAGHRCPYLNSAPIKCTKGKYQDHKGQKSCKWCKDGEYSFEIGRTTKCDICPGGHRCPYVNAAPIKCRKGKFQDQTGQKSCKWCKAGQYNLQTGCTTCESCPAGSKCKFVDTAPLPCKEGRYSPAESTKCFSCPSGSFCPSRSTLPVAPSNDTALKSKIHSIVKYAAEAYKDKNDSALNGLRLMNSDKKVQGYVKFQDNAIVVSFRGTVYIKDWIANAKLLKRNYQNCVGCKVHTGFSNYYNSVKLQMLTKVSALSHAHPNATVIVTGHSLGGAQATLAAVDLTKAGYATDLITYGSPRVGNKQFSEYADKTLTGLNLRVTYKDDIATVTPPQSIGYWHVGEEMHYTNQNTGFKLPPKTDVKYNRLSLDDHRMVNYKKLN